MHSANHVAQQTLLRTLSLSLPNCLTISRVFIAFLIGVMPHIGTGTVLWLYAIGILTDFLDGKLARYFNAQSKFGRGMDSTADKLLVMGVLIALLNSDYIGVYLLFFFLARELVVFGLRSIQISGRNVASINDGLGRIRFLILHIGILGILSHTVFLPQTSFLLTASVYTVVVSIFLSYLVLVYYVWRDRTLIMAAMNEN